MPLSSDHREPLWTAIGLSACFYLLILTLVFFTPTNQAMWDQALGASPYGIPQRLFLLLWITGICLPLPYGFYHTLVILHFTKRERTKKSATDLVADTVLPFRAIVSYTRFLLSEKGVPTSIKRSLWISLGLLIYLILVAIAWIFWAESKGI